MRYKLPAVLLPCALTLSACTAVTPVCKDSGTHSDPYVEDGPNGVAQKFRNAQIQNRAQNPAALRPCLNDGLVQLLNDAHRDPTNSKLLQTNPFSSSSTPVDNAVITSASTIPNRDACNIPLCVELKQGTQSWKDEVLMIQEGQCWAIGDVCYLGSNSHVSVGTLRQNLEKR